MTTVDALIIGGGIFGCHAAIHLARQGKKVVLVEQEAELIKRASIVNQARLHAGYHYPRSIATAKTSDNYIQRFRDEFGDCINDSYVHYYAIARRGSLTDAAQFQHFCDYLNLPCERTENHPAFNYDQLEAVFAAHEDSFDPPLLAARYREMVASYAYIDVRLSTRVAAVKRVELQSSRTPFDDSQVAIQFNHTSSNNNSEELPDLTSVNEKTPGQEVKHEPNTAPQKRNGYFEVSLHSEQPGQSTHCSTPLVINATYASINTTNRQFGVAEIPLMHEIAEMAFVRPHSSFQDAALTVMDGPFCSLMPYGKTGLHSLSSVAYTHQRVSYANEPSFGCQALRDDCLPHATADCSTCAAQPVSNYPKMLAQLRRYLNPAIELEYVHSRFTIKAKLQANHIDDGRPTAVRLLHHDPAFFCVFAGKVNSVYAMETALDGR